nr:Anaphase-promoting complex subunit 8 [Ipomoea batatas]
MGSKENYRNEFCAAIRHLNNRCLYSAAKWAAEQLVGIEQDPSKGEALVYCLRRTKSRRRVSLPGRRLLLSPSLSEDGTKVDGGELYCSYCPAHRKQRRKTTAHQSPSTRGGRRRHCLKPPE